MQKKGNRFWSQNSATSFWGTHKRRSNRLVAKKRTPDDCGLDDETAAVVEKGCQTTARHRRRSLFTRIKLLNHLNSTVLLDRPGSAYSNHRYVENAEGKK